MEEAMITTETAPQFTDSIQAAKWLEEYLRGVTTRDVGALDLGGTRTAPSRGDHGDAFHVTEVVDDCLRRAIFRLRGTERDFSDEQSMHWAHTGHLYESWVRAALRLIAPGRIVSNREVVGIPHSVGFADLWWKDAWLVIDVKSKAIGSRGKPIDKDMRQVASYAAHMTKRYGERPILAVLVYVYREDLSQIDCFPVPYEYESMLSWYEARAAALAQFKSSNDPVPVMGLTSDTFPCSFETRDGRKFCAYFSQCWAAVGKTIPAPSAPRFYELEGERERLAEERKALEKKAKELKEVEDQLYNEMKPFFEEHGELILGLPEWEHNVKNIVVGPQTGYDVKTALAKEPDLAARLEPYKTVSSGYSYPRTVKKSEVRKRMDKAK
jgi:hypothetical protein